MKKTTLIGVGLAVVAAMAAALYFTSQSENPAANSDMTSADSTAPAFRAGDLQLSVTTDPGTPRVGDNTLVIELWRADGERVSDIDVDAFAEMPAMGAMPAMRAPADLEQTALGRFEGELNLSMRGEWPLTVEITDPQGGDQRLIFGLATDRAEIAIASGGTPIDGLVANVDDALIMTIDNRRRQLIGLKTGEATHRNLVKKIRAVGTVTYDERLLSQVTLKFDGYIGDLLAEYVGAPIVEGQVLFTVYSPELLAAQQEYLETRNRRADRGAKDTLVRAARKRLQLWDMSVADIRALEQSGMPQEYVAIRAPRAGTLIARNIADGGAARMGQTLLSIADLSRVWIEADIYETDLELVTVGTPVTVRLPYLPNQAFTANVEYVYPYLHGNTRTGRVRLTLDNTEGVLKPEMYAELSLHAPLGHRLSVPEEAVIFAGDSRVVFVDLGEGRLKPTIIQTGRRADGYIEVLEGLKLGDSVVTSGNFLVAAETRLKAGLDQW
jgi:Cu(I)/Ag(I) efflux system membrane fusion protein